MKKIHSHSDWNYAGFEELILKCGQEMEATPLPKALKLGLPKRCYYNCQKIAFEREDLSYVEGYVLFSDISFPIAHAWLLANNHVALDPTVKKPGLAYLGVAFSKEWVKSLLAQRRQKGRDDELSVFESNYLEEYSLLKQGLPPDALLK